MSMKRIIKSLSILILTAFAGMLYANGGGIYYSTGISSGNISLVENRSISLEKESLNIVIDGDYARVNVKYKFRNSSKENRLLYGFPVAFRGNTEEDSESGEDKKEITDSISDFKLKFNGQDIAAEKVNRSFEPNEHFDDQGRNTTVYRWYTATLKFPEGDSTLDVSYVIENCYYEETHGKGGVNQFSNSEFMYILSPSGNWGNGIVKEFNVSVDFSKAANDGNKLVKIEGLNLAGKDDIYSGNFKDFDMVKAKPLVVSYDITDVKLSRFMECGTGCNVEDEEGMKASSSMKGFEPCNADDGNPETAWIDGSGKGGAGEWIEINTDFHTGGLAIVNGMAASKELYYKYGRIKKLRLELLYNDGLKKTEEITLLNKKYPAAEVKEKSFYTILYTTRDEEAIPDRARMTILEVYPGSEFKSAAVSDIYTIHISPGE